MRIKDFNEILSFGDELLGLRVYVPYEPCDRIGFIIKVTDVSIVYKYFDVQRRFEFFRTATGRINCDNFKNAVIENLHHMIVDRNLKKDKSSK